MVYCVLIEILLHHIQSQQCFAKYKVRMHVSMYTYLTYMVEIYFHVMIKM